MWIKNSCAHIMPLQWWYLDFQNEISHVSLNSVAIKENVGQT